jgi:hypothetical protein
MARRDGDRHPCDGAQLTDGNSRLLRRSLLIGTSDRGAFRGFCVGRCARFMDFGRAKQGKSCSIADKIDEMSLPGAMLTL